MAEINVVPYIDVMLVLLVIFMITTPLLSQGVKVDLPQAKAEALAQKDHEPIVVSINDHGQYFVNLAAKPSVPMDVSAIQLLVRDTLTKDGINNPNPRPVLVKADQSVNYGVVVKIMALLQQAGATSVGLVTDEPAAVQAATVKVAASSGNAWRG